MAEMFFYGWMIVALGVILYVLIALNIDRRKREDADAKRIMIREAERRG